MKNVPFVTVARMFSTLGRVRTIETLARWEAKRLISFKGHAVAAQHVAKLGASVWFGQPDTN